MGSKWVDEWDQSFQDENGLKKRRRRKANLANCGAQGFRLWFKLGLSLSWLYIFFLSSCGSSPHPDTILTRGIWEQHGKWDGEGVLEVQDTFMLFGESGRKRTVQGAMCWPEMQNSKILPSFSLLSALLLTRYQFIHQKLNFKICKD